MSRAEPVRKLTPNQQARRARILDAARRLVAEHGYEGMIMRDVAHLANVSPTTLYNLYNTKDELVLEALRESMADSWISAEQTTELGFDRLLTQVSHSVAQTQEGSAYAKAITQALLRANGADPLVKVLINRNAKAVTSSLQAMQAQNQLVHAVDINRLALDLVGVFWSNYMLWSKDIVALDQLELNLKRAYLSYLQPVTQGALHERIKQHLSSLV